MVSAKNWETDNLSTGAEASQPDRSTFLLQQLVALFLGDRSFVEGDVCSHSEKKLLKEEEVLDGGGQKVQARSYAAETLIQRDGVRVQAKVVERRDHRAR